MSLEKKYKRLNSRKANGEKMEVELRFDELITANNAIGTMLDKKFVFTSAAVKLAEIARRLGPVAEDIFRRRDEVLMNHAKHDEDGNVLYKNEEKTEIDTDDEFEKEITKLFASKMQMNFPRLSTSELEVLDEQFTVRTLYPVCFLFDVDMRKVEITRNEIISTLQSVDWFLDDKFEDVVSVAKIAKMRLTLALSAIETYNKRSEIITEHALRDRDGEIIYDNKETGDVKTTPKMLESVNELMESKFEISVPALSPYDLMLLDGSSIPPRRLIGLMPYLNVDMAE